MSESKFTSGPWNVTEDEEPDMEWNRHVESAPNKRICFMAHDGPNRSLEFEANAYLIAAAPTMFDALLNTREFVADELDNRDYCAGGDARDYFNDAKYVNDAKCTLALIDAALAKARGEN